MIRILIADDHAIVRRGLKQILADFHEEIEVDEAGDGGEAVSKALADRYGMVLLDISMPVRSGLDALRELRALRPGLPVLMLSIHPEEEYAVRTIRAGASGYLMKESAPDELLLAIRKVLRGGRYVSTSLAERLAFGPAPEETAPHEALSERELQVFRLLTSGKAMKEIAGELSLSIKTVSTYRTRILEKMKMKSNTELIRYALRTRLLE